MKRSVSTAVALFAACAGVAMSAVPVLAQQFPNRPVTILVGVPPGGPFDFLGRAVAPRLQERWGQPVVVENRPGAGTLLSFQGVQKAPPDGHTIAIGTSGTYTIPLFIKQADIEVGKNLQPLLTVFSATSMLWTNNQVPAKNMRDFIAYAKANPGKINFVTIQGTSYELDVIAFAEGAGIKTAFIPYKGSGPSIASLVANETQLFLSSPGGMTGLIAEGRVVPLATAGAARLPNFPDVPTVKEAAGFDYDVTLDYGYVTTQGTPRPTIDRITKDIAEIMGSPEMREQIVKQGYNPRIILTDELTASIASYVRRYRELAQRHGIKPQ
jgi:tripartite-type tricarboxylate transporter receptor subunit TctC